MNKKLLLFSGLIILLAIVVFFSIANINRSKLNKMINRQAEIKWQTYKNEGLGFQISYPQQIDIWNGNCLTENNQLKITHALVPTKMFVDAGTVWVSYEYFYENIEGACRKIDNSVSLLKKQTAWKIVIADNITSDQDLNSFIKEFYQDFGSNCQLGEKHPAKQNGVYDIVTAYDRKDLGESTCFINGLSVMKYYPAKHKVAAWLIGQEPMLSGNRDGEEDITFDQTMIDSFKFLE